MADDVRHERHRWTPVRRIYIPKKKSGQRPLGLPTWKDKLLQEVMRAKFFDTMNHEVLLTILAEKIHDNRFLRLVRHLLESGYLEEWTFNQTLSGCPPGGVISPILSNIYLDKLDQYVEHVLIPKYTRGEKRADNPTYSKLNAKANWLKRKGKLQEAKALRRQYQKLLSFDPHEDAYRRLHYVRYADDTLFGFVGTRDEAEEIKQQLGQFLRETLKLELSQEKTLITPHASTEAARFLNYHIVNQQNSTKHTKKRRCVNGHMGLLVPPDVVTSKCAPYLLAEKPIHRTEMLDDDDFTIIERYQQEYRGIVQYYLLAQNVTWFWKLHWVARRSLLKTLAYKHRTSVMVQVQNYKASFQAANGTTYACLEIQVQREGKKPLVVRFGAIPLKLASNDKCGRSNCMLRLAEGPTEKGCNRSTSLAAYSKRKTAS